MDAEVQSPAAAIKKQKKELLCVGLMLFLEMLLQAEVLRPHSRCDGTVTKGNSLQNRSFADVVNYIMFFCTCLSEWPSSSGRQAERSLGNLASCHPPQALEESVVPSRELCAKRMSVALLLLPGHWFRGLPVHTIF